MRIKAAMQMETFIRKKKKKKQKNKCGGTETAGKGGRGHCTPWKYAKAGGVPTFP